MKRKPHTITLTTTHPTESSDWMEKVLGLTADHARSVGAARMAPDGRFLGVNEESCCVFKLQTGADIGDDLSEIGYELLDQEAGLMEIRAGGGSTELCVGIFVDGASDALMELRQPLFSRFLRLGLQFSFEVHAGELSAAD